MNPAAWRAQELVSSAYTIATSLNDQQVADTVVLAPPAKNAVGCRWSDPAPGVACCEQATPAFAGLKRITAYRHARPAPQEQACGTEHQDGHGGQRKALLRGSHIKRLILL